ncbi:MAG: helix-turn-helix domain-containing protein, partial [Bacteroidia bacterium]
EAIQNSSQYFNLISNVLQVSLQEDGNQCRLLFTQDKEIIEAHPEVCQHLLYSSMVFAWQELSFLLGRTYQPWSVHFTASAEHQNEAERIFACPLYFESLENVISFDTSILAQKIIFSDYQLMLTLEQVACQRLTDLGAHNQLWQDKIKQMIYAMLGPQIPSIESLAHNLAISPRSLQRKLKAEGSSYAQLTLEIKKDLALVYLQKDLNINEVSFLMGYTEASSFINAFKRWFGQSPLRYRKAL